MTTDNATLSLSAGATQRKATVDPAVKARNIKLLLLDVDGVLTDGGIWYTDAGDELKRFHVRDGSGLRIWQDAGLKVAILSGRTSAAVERRAKELGIFPIIQGQADKRAALSDILTATGATADQVCAVGDDLPDIPLMTACGLSAAVADAAAEVRAVASYTTAMPGGRGAVREVIEWLLKLRGEWTAAVGKYTI